MTKGMKNGGKLGDGVVAYYRVSTEKQGRSGLGLEAQRKAVMDFLHGDPVKLVGEFTEVESGRRSDRPELEAALKLCKQTRSTLVIAKLDRLARNVHFISGLMQRRVKFVATDMPHANEFTIHIMAAVAEQERKMISARTKAGLERAKARGVKLGQHGKMLAVQNAEKAQAQARDLAPTIKEIRGSGLKTVRAIMDEMNHRGIKTLRGGRWHPHTINVLLRRIDKICQ